MDKKEKMNLKDCTCEACVNACKRMPGWFAPGEAEKAAEAIGIPWEEFKKKLIIDYWCGENETYVWRPRRITGDENSNGGHLDVASWGSAFARGVCSFLEADRCTIHKVKPYECRHTKCAGKPEKLQLREKISKMWQESGKDPREE